MKLFKIVLSASLAASIFTSPATAGETVTNDSLKANEFQLIVTFENGVSESEQDEIVSSVSNTSLLESHEITDSTSVLKATGSESAALLELEQNPSVESVSIDKINKFARTPNDFNQAQWYLKPWATYQGINAEAAWDITTGASDVTVAVLDTGKVNHPDLVGKWLPGWDFVQNDNDPTDPGLTPGDDTSSEWHGTEIAGVIAAATDNGLGISGIDWNSKIVPVRVGSGDGAFDSNLIKGIRWAAGLEVSGVTRNSNPAKLINISWGSEDSCSSDFQLAIDAAVGAGSLVVVAAGNESDDADYYSPASCANVVSVGASNSYGQLADFSNYGSSVDLLAPGASIHTTSCYPTNSCSSYQYGAVNGTSFSAPVVVGVASLMLSVNPALTPGQLESLLVESTNLRSGTNYDCQYFGCGSGIVDALAATQGALELVQDLAWAESTTTTLTLPLNDSYQDTFSVSFNTVSSETAYVTILNSDGNDTLVLNNAVTPATRTASTYRGQATITPSNLVAGNYTIRVTQGVNTLDKALIIGSGILSSVSISKSSNVYPYKDGYLDTAIITILGKDSLGNSVPMRGKVTLNGVPITLTAAKQTATWDWSKIPKGTYDIVATGIGMASGSTKTAKTTIIIGASVAKTASISASSTSVYPIKDNYLDTVSLTFSITTNTNKAVLGSATVTIFQGTKKVKTIVYSSLKLSPGQTKTVVWDGKVSGKVLPGTYKAEISFKSAENSKFVKEVKNITVSGKKRVLKTTVGPWYYAADAFVDCAADSYGDCYYYESTGIKLDAYGTIGMQSSLPFPVDESVVHSWRVKTYGWSPNPSYYIIYPCETDEFVYSCDSGDSGTISLTGSAYTDTIWTTNYSALGRSDGYADWMITSNSYTNFYALEFQVEVKYWKIE